MENPNISIIHIFRRGSNRPVPHFVLRVRVKPAVSRAGRP